MTKLILIYKKNPAAVIFGILVFSVLISFSIYRYLRGNSYQVTHPTQGPIIEAIYGLGTVHATRTYTVKPGVTTHIREIAIEEGERVKKGQLLLRTDEQTVTAPWDGVITSLPINEGENTMAGTRILTLSDPKNHNLLISLEQQDALRIHSGQTALISFENLRENKITGVVKEVYAKDEQQFNVRIDLETLPPGILPGMTADVSIEIGKRENAMLVPISALHQSHIRIRKQGRFQNVPCTIGVTDGRFAEITNPTLSADDEIQIPKAPVNEN